MFTAGRAYEQVRNSVAYPRLNVKVIGSHGSLTSVKTVATHQCIEDLSLMRGIPGMMVLNPCDAPEMRAAVKALISTMAPLICVWAGALWKALPNMDGDYTFELGKGVTLRDGSDVTIIATGMMVQMALKAADMLAEKIFLPVCWIFTPSSLWMRSWC